MALYFLLVLYQLATFACGEPLAPALYVFGDSLVDSGNNNILYTFAKANYFPYGANFPSGTTGRFTNGRTVADFLGINIKTNGHRRVVFGQFLLSAEFLRLPYPPPCLSITNAMISPVTGLNYASGSCGILPETGKIVGNCLSLDEQIGLFEATASLKLPYRFKNNNDLAKYLSESLYLFSIGSNDYIITYLGTSNSGYTPQQFAQLLSDKLSKALQRMYDLGARKFVIFELGPIGCIPSITKKKGWGSGKCVEETNQIVSFFNKKLGPMLQNLETTLPASKFVLGRSNWLCYDLTINPAKHGIRYTSETCCRTWLNGTSSCIPLEAPCQNPNQFYFFDAFHPTEAIHSLVASRCINDTSVCFPTINHLVNL